jgi:serine/threonine protein phosphatase 1
LQRELKTRMPKTHLAFLAALRSSHVEGDYLFAHAGVRPGIPLSDQVEADLLWIREPFLCSAEDFGKVVVHGHTPTREPVLRANRIGVDTGACYGGALTALVLEGEERRFLQV